MTRRMRLYVLIAWPLVIMAALALGWLWLAH